MDHEKFTTLVDIKERLQAYHGATKLRNIPEASSFALFLNLSADTAVTLDQTVNDVLKRIYTTLNTESMISQFWPYQKAMKTKSILPASRLPENQRLEFYRGKNTHERLQMLLSPDQYYFTINRTQFRKNDRKHNCEVFQKAIDTVVIDPENIADSSLETLWISLDQDCQNLKEIFKQMRPLNYQDAEEKKSTIRIHEYDGKYIVFSAYKTVFDAEQPATKWEQRKEDIIGHMSVYPDIFSMIRRENYIMQDNQEKQATYQNIKKELVASIKRIDRNKKAYGPGLQQSIAKLIAEIDQSSSSKLAAIKTYRLYRLTWRHSENDKLVLTGILNDFTKRMAQLIGISAHTQLHLVELDDILEDQTIDIQSFHAQVPVSIHKPTIKWQQDSFFVTCENYYNNLKRYMTLKEPFLTFAQQIQSVCGKTLLDVKRNISPEMFAKIQEVVRLQEKVLAWYTLEHELNLEEKTIAEVAEELKDIQPGFSVDMTKQQRDNFFDELKNLKILQREIDEIIGKPTT